MSTKQNDIWCEGQVELEAERKEFIKDKEREDEGERKITVNGCKKYRVSVRIIMQYDITAPNLYAANQKALDNARSDFKGAKSFEIAPDRKEFDELVKETTTHVVVCGLDDIEEVIAR